MLAPDGHYSWTEIFGCIDRLGETLFYAHFEELRGRDPVSCFTWGSPATTIGQISKVAGTSTAAQAEFFRELLKCWLLAQFMVAYEPLLCSKNGRPIRASLAIFLHADRLDLCDWRWKWGATYELRDYFRFHDINGFCARDVYARFGAFDPARGVITLKNNTDSLLTAATGPEQSPKFGWAALVELFAGLSICWKQTDVPDLLSDVLTDFGLPEAEWARSSERSSPNQTLTEKELLHAVLDQYPEGKGSDSWREVERNLGHPRRQIARTLAQNGRYSAWIDHRYTRA